MDAWLQFLEDLADQEMGVVALEAPDQLNDSTAGLACPHCGSLETAVQEVEDAEVELSGTPEMVKVAVCLGCTAEFFPPKPGEAQLAVESVLERRAAQARRKYLVL